MDTFDMPCIRCEHVKAGENRYCGEGSYCVLVRVQIMDQRVRLDLCKACFIIFCNGAQTYRWPKP